MESGLSNANQFEFKAGNSTEDAILKFKESINTKRKYVVALFIDIQGAFDNLWWPAIRHRLVSANCSTQLVNILNSYFGKRKVIVRSKYKTFCNNMEKGCPQGSVLGPSAWNWCMYSLLNRINIELNAEKAEAIAYADNLAVLLKADNRVSIEKTAKQVIDILDKWCSLHKLKVSVEKTNAMVVKGKLSKKRNPTMKNKNVKFTTMVKYLGVTLDEKMSFIEHAKP